MALSKLRRPIFFHDNPNGSVAVSTTTMTATNSSTTTSSAGSLVNYTRICHKRLASSMISVRVNQNDDDDDDDDGRDHQTGGGGDYNKRNNNNNNSNDTVTTSNLEQCIILLEPILDIFQSNCITNDKARRNQGGRNYTDKANKRMQEDMEEGEEEEADEDEIPPQLLRAAKFFPYRFIPMKKALLRPPHTLPLSLSSSVSGKGGNQARNAIVSHSSAAVAVELSLYYRLRLARACWKRGLVAAAEYETLQKSIERMATSRKRKSCNNTDGEVDDDDDNNNNDDKEEANNLVERVRLSFLRLPTEAMYPHRSISAWNHVQEMVSQCSALWEKDTDEAIKKSVFDEDIIDVKSLITPNQVADWAMTSWTALLLVRGLDCVIAPPLSSSTNNARHHHRDNSISSIERQLATLLTNRSGTSSDANKPAIIDLARAVKCRINMLLHPGNIQLLNGIHLYSLGRLLASFHNRDDAVQHIATSVCQCAIESGGISGLEQLSRLLAVFLCCLPPLSLSTSMNENGTKPPSIVGDVEATLRDKLDDEEFMTSIVNALDSTEGRVGRHSPSLVRRKSKTFLDAIFSTTAHLVKSCELLVTDRE